MLRMLSDVVCACSPNSKFSYNCEDFDEDPLGWSRDLEQHKTGEFSMASVRANNVMEDYCQVENGNKTLFLGVYDGHYGSDASQHISRNLFGHLLRRIPRNQDGDISEEILGQAVADTEEEFMTVVERDYLQKRELGRVGSCCLVGYMYRGLTLYLANLGDSRAVLGYEDSNGKLRVAQLTDDHNCNTNEAIRNHLMQRYPRDPQYVFKNRGAWRVKGITKVSRSIGDAYLKRRDFTLRQDFPKYETVPPPFRGSVVSREAETHTKVLRDEDRFVIFASHGLWEFLSNQKAAEIVHRNPRRGIAKRLIREAMEKAVKKGKTKMSYFELQKKEDNRREYHDDMTVIVLFFDNDIRQGRTRDIDEVSYRGFTNTVAPSDFQRGNDNIASCSRAA